MEVKVDMKVLPHVFVLPDNNRVAITDNPEFFVDCKREDCLLYKDATKIKKVSGIYFTPREPAITIKFRKATIRTAKDVIKLVRRIQPFGEVPEARKFLIKYHPHSVIIYDRFIRGRRLEFPVVFEYEDLKVYKVPEPPDIYIIDGETLKKKLNMDLFHKTNYMGYGVSFDKDVLIHEYFSIFPGRGELIYFPENTNVNVDDKSFSVEAGSWLIFSFESKD